LVIVQDVRSRNERAGIKPLPVVRCWLREAGTGILAAMIADGLMLTRGDGFYASGSSGAVGIFWILAIVVLVVFIFAKGVATAAGAYSRATPLGASAKNPIDGVMQRREVKLRCLRNGLVILLWTLLTGKMAAGPLILLVPQILVLGLLYMTWHAFRWQKQHHVTLWRYPRPRAQTVRLSSVFFTTPE
jgi:hypothetical protein